MHSPPDAFGTSRVKNSTYRCGFTTAWRGPCDRYLNRLVQCWWRRSATPCAVSPAGAECFSGLQLTGADTSTTTDLPIDQRGYDLIKEPADAKKACKKSSAIAYVSVSSGQGLRDSAISCCLFSYPNFRQIVSTLYLQLPGASKGTFMS